MHRIFFYCVGAMAFLPGFAPGSARAADIDGVWASSAAVCSQVFAKKGNAISFTDKSDAFGSGFILQGNQIRGKIATCNIQKRKDDGKTVNIVANCATSIALETMHLVFNVEGANRLTRVFQGIPELNTVYERCSL